MSEQTEHKVDRTGWDPGPWDGEPDKAVWTTKAGLPGMIVRNTNGALCGYVAVPREHPLYGVPYSDGEWPNSPEGQFNCHGGLTYSAKCRGSICHVPEPGQPDDVWWFGFDCNHSGDYAPQSAKWRKIDGIRGDLFARRPGEEYREFPYVRSEVESLATQIAAVTQWPPPSGGTPHE